MAASKFQFRIFVVGMVITLSSLLVFSPVKAETDNQFRGYWMAWETVEEGYMYQSYTTYQNVVVVTNDPTAAGYTVVTNDSYGTDPFTRNIRFAGTYTAYENLDAQQFTAQAFPDPMHYRYGTFTAAEVYQGDTDNPETVSLSATSLQALANAISVAVGSYDDTQLLQTLDAINLLISSIDTSVSGIATAIVSLNTVASNIYNLLSDIDNLIDTITWKDDPYFQFLGYSTTIDGTLVNSISSNTKTIYFHFFYGGSGDGANSNLKKIRTNVTTSITGAGDNDQPSLKLYYFNGSDYVLRTNADLWCRRDLYGRCTIYSTYSFYSNSDRHFVIEFTWPRTSGRAVSSNTLDCHYIGINDIEYWSLLQYFETHEFYNSHNNELEQPNEDLSESVDDYIEQEDNLIDGFDNAIESQDVDPSNLPDSNPANWGVEFVGSLNMIGMVFNQLTGALTGGNPVYMLMNFSLMFGLALLIIGKRG